MSCPYLEQIFLLDSARYDAIRARALERHAESCATCAPVLARLRSARIALMSQSTAVPADAPMQIWANITVKESGFRSRLLAPRARNAEAERRLRDVLLAPRATNAEGERRVRELLLAPRAMIALSAFATVMVVWLVFFRPHAAPIETPLPAEAPVVAANGDDGSTPFARGRVRPQPGAKWHASDDGISTSIVLDSGAIEVELELGGEVEILTGEARIRALSGRVLVGRISAGTEVKTQVGKVEIWARGRTLPVALAEGKTLLVVAARAEPAPNKERSRPRRSEKRSAVDAAADLKVARTMIDVDPPRAVELAERVLESGPSAELEVEALAVLADAQRRRGFFEAAALSYAKLRDHPRGAGYAEEAMLQRALLLERVGARSGALEELVRLEAAHPSGVSAPERAALAAKIYLASGDPIRAARAIMEVRFEGRSRALENRRVEVAKVLMGIDAALAEKLMKGSNASGNRSSEANR